MVKLISTMGAPQKKIGTRTNDGIIVVAPPMFVGSSKPSAAAMLARITFGSAEFPHEQFLRGALSFPEPKANG
jgi:hypothetical protein